MDVIIILSIVVGALFALAYFSRRRFGTLGLALCAGFLLSTMWTADVTPLIRKAGIVFSSPPLSSVVAAVLILTPAIVLMLGGPTYRKHGHRIIAAIAFALLATAFLLSPLGSSINLDDKTQQIYRFLFDNRNVVITVAVVYALFDVVTYKTPKKER